WIDGHVFHVEGEPDHVAGHELAVRPRRAQQAIGEAIVRQLQLATLAWGQAEGGDKDECGQHGSCILSTTQNRGNINRLPLTRLLCKVMPVFARGEWPNGPYFRRKWSRQPERQKWPLF